MVYLRTTIMHKQSICQQRRSCTTGRWAPRRRHVLDNDVDLVTLQKLLGHANVQMTAHYNLRGE